MLSEVININALFNLYQQILPFYYKQKPSFLFMSMLSENTKGKSRFILSGFKV